MRIERSDDGRMLLEWRCHPLTEREELKVHKLELEPVLIQDAGAGHPLVDYWDDGFRLTWSWQAPWTSIRFHSGLQESRVVAPMTEVSWRGFGDVVEATPFDRNGNQGVTQLLRREVTRPVVEVTVNDRHPFILSFAAVGAPPAGGTLSVRRYQLRDNHYSTGAQQAFRLKHGRWLAELECDRTFIGMIAVIWERDDQKLLLQGYTARNDKVLVANAADRELLRQTIERAAPVRGTTSFIDRWPAFSRDRLQRVAKVLTAKADRADIVGAWPHALTGAYRSAVLSFYDVRDAGLQVAALDSGDFVSALSVALFGTDLDMLRSSSSETIVWAIRNAATNGVAEVLTQPYETLQRDRALEVHALLNSARALRKALCDDSEIAAAVQAKINDIDHYVREARALDRRAVADQLATWTDLLATESIHPEQPAPNGREAHRKWENERIARQEWLTELESLLSFWVSGGKSPAQGGGDVFARIQDLLPLVTVPPSPFDDKAPVEDGVGQSATKLLNILGQHPWDDPFSRSVQVCLRAVVQYGALFERLIAEIDRVRDVLENWQWLAKHLPADASSSLETCARRARNILELDRQRMKTRDELVASSTIDPVRIMEIVSTPHHPAAGEEIREIEARLQRLNANSVFPSIPVCEISEIAEHQLLAWWSHLRDLSRLFKERGRIMESRRRALEEQKNHLVHIADNILRRAKQNADRPLWLADLADLLRRVNHGELEAVQEIQVVLSENRYEHLID